MNIKFRENHHRFQVDVVFCDQVVYSHSEYRGAAEWAQRNYGLSDPQLLEIYRDYKDECDRLDNC